MNLRRYIPLLSWLPGYHRRQFRGDVTAGLTVGVMLIPQGMAYAMLAGMPPIYGLYASIIPLILYAIFGTSRQLAVGPVAMVALLISSGVGKLAETGSETFIELAILLALMVGVLQFMLGVFRLGFLVNFLSHPVISGFTSAAALIIGLSQLKHLLGVDIPRSHHIHKILIAAGEQIAEIHLPTLILGGIAIGVILLIKRYLKKIPGPLVAVVLGILAVVGMGLAEGGMKIVGEVPSGLPVPTLPTVDGDALASLVPIALTIGLVGFMESIAVAKAIQAKHKDYEIDANQELIGLGLANIGGALFRSFPTTGGFSRTAVNDQAGAQTGLASIISAGFIALTLLFLTPLFYYLPKAILASVIMVAVFGLIDFKEMRHLWKTDRVDLGLLLATFLATLVLGIELGIGVGVALSLIMVIYRSAYPHVAELGRLAGTPYYRNVDRFPDAEQRADVLVVRFDAQMYFANAGFFRDKIDQLARSKGAALKLIVLNAESITFMDSSAVEMLKEMVRDYRNAGVSLALASVIGPVRDILFRSGLVEVLGPDAVFVHCSDAVDYYDRRRQTDPDRAEAIARKPYAKAALQTNVSAPADPGSDADSGH
ncbi:MAG: solute carrier family 26 protein [Bacteroidota bacterium]